MGVPAALRAEVAAWRAAGRPRQEGSAVSRGAWIAAVPRRAGVVRTLPARLDRVEARRVVAGLLARGDVEGAFVVSQIWGYGDRGYGPYRARTVLSQEDAVGHLEAVVEILRRRGAEAAFAAFAGEQRIPGLGPSFFTKFLFLADPNREALVLDAWVAAWLRRHAGLRLALRPPRPEAYVIYLRTMRRWAGELGVAPEELEELVVTAEARTRPSARGADVDRSAARA